MSKTIIDRLFQKVEENGVVCLGLDTSLEYVPLYLRNQYSSKGEAIFQFNKKVIDKTFDVVACYKVQIAYYESLGIEGLIAYKKTLDYIRSKDALVIGDIKRGDISATAKMYAKAHFEGDFECDFITLSPYMGLDSIEPYLPYIEKGDKGVFALVRTSNPGAEDIEYIESLNGKKVYEIVGEKLSSMGKNFIGECGYSSIGGVIGCTHVDEAKRMRKDLSKMFFLIPGYGAQGGKAEDVALYLKNGNGGVVNSSRKILLAYKENNRDTEFEIAAREEAIRMRDEIKEAINSL